MKIYRVSVPCCQVACDCQSCCGVCYDDEELIGFYTSAEMAKIAAFDARLAERAAAREQFRDIWKDAPDGMLEERVKRLEESVERIYVKVEEIEVNEATAPLPATAEDAKANPKGGSHAQ
jgi:hypothetical protein